jgi:hypothetical protein
LNFSPARCSDEPIPPIPIVSVCGFAFAKSIKALRSLAGKSPRPTNRLVTRATMVIGVKSATGSYGSVE